mgnify:CR=1 FL=1
MLRLRFDIPLLMTASLSIASLIGSSHLATAAEVTLPDGGRCQGEISNSTLNGKGSCTYANGDRYEGNFVNGKREGTGTYT